MILFVVAYLGSVLTIVSPCILPVLPFVFARAFPMVKKIALVAAALALIASRVFASAAITSPTISEHPTVQDLHNIVKVLQRFSQLITARQVKGMSNSTQPVGLAADPPSGTAPLFVTFTGSGSGTTYFGGIRLNFGDGTTVTLCNPGTSCGPFSTTHTYQQSGTYTATLTGIGEGGNTIIGTATIMITSTAQ